MEVVVCEGWLAFGLHRAASGQALQPDMPSPEGFVSRQNVVSSNPTAAWRVVNQTLEGRNRRVEGAAQFYREIWPAHGWRLENSGGDLKSGPYTLAFSKKRENFEAAVALHFAAYNFCRTHNTLKMTPAMYAGIERDFWTVSDLVKAAS